MTLDELIDVIDSDSDVTIQLFADDNVTTYDDFCDIPCDDYGYEVVSINVYSHNIEVYVE